MLMDGQTDHVRVGASGRMDDGKGDRWKGRRSEEGSVGRWADV